MDRFWWRTKKSHLKLNKTCKGKKTNNLLEEAKIILSKVLKIFLINGYSIFNGAKYFAEDGS